MKTIPTTSDKTSPSAAATPSSFEDICTRLDDIAGEVRDKKTSLERSLDLFDEAIKLGSSAVDLVDITELSEKEQALFQQDNPLAEVSSNEETSSS